MSSTLEMESYLLPHPSKVATVDIETESVITAVQSKQDFDDGHAPGNDGEVRQTREANVP